MTSRWRSTVMSLAEEGGAGGHPRRRGNALQLLTAITSMKKPPLSAG